MTFGQFSIDYVFWGAIMSTEIENDYRSYLLKTWILIWLRVVGICILQKGVVIYMKKFGKVVVKLRIPILVLSFLLLIPSVLGYFNTRVNYDILYYLPNDIDTMQGQDILLDDFGKGAYAMVVVDGMNKSNVSKLVKKVENQLSQVHVHLYRP